jgi:uncharacterized protein (TIGR02271 family)
MKSSDVYGNRTGTGTMENVDTANLMPLSRMDDFKVAEDDKDVRGWSVIARDGERIGKVDDLLVDTNARRVRYLGVDLDRGLLSGGHSGHVLVPIESVRLDRNDKVLLDSVGRGEVMSLPTYDASMFGRSQAFAGERTTRRDLETDREARLTLSEEELALGKRPVAAGEVGVSKHVETQHVREAVPVMREEVTVERRPVTGTSTDARIEEGEIHVPLTQEEVLVEKRVVPKEEVVIKKHQVQGEQVVEDEIRRERAEVHRTGDATVRDDVTDVTDTNLRNEQNRRR